MELLTSECLYCKAPTKAHESYCCSACSFLHNEVFKDSDSKKISSQFEYLDQPETLKQFQITDQKNAFKFYIQDIQCSSCVHLIEKLPEYYSNCLNSRLNFGTSELLVELTPEGSLAKVAQIIADMGYHFVLIRKEEDFQKLIIQEERRELKRIAVAGAIAGNIMLFSFSIYAGADGYIKQIFVALNVLLFIPFITYVAYPFYQGALSSLKTQKIHIDLPITVALISTSVLSLYNLLRGSDEFYFDSTASFIFLILVARFFVKKTQRKYLSPQNQFLDHKNETYLVNENQIKCADDVKKFDQLSLSQDQILPVDGILISEKALVNTATLTGESTPQHFTQGMKLFAGYKILSHSALVEAQTTFKKSKMSELLSTSLQHLVKKNSYLNLTDRLSEKLILSVITIAFITFIVVFITLGFESAFNRSLALLVVACPCALAFGGPLALSMAYKKALKRGISIRDPNVFEKLSQTQHVFFDKTGTLTTGTLELVDLGPENLSLENINILLNLEKISYHPIAFAIRDYFKNYKFQILPITNLTETLGVGVRGEYNNNIYEAKSLSQQSFEDEIDFAIGFYKNKEIIARLYFKDQIRSESKKIISLLNYLNIKSYLVSGDKKRKALSLGKDCGILTENIYSELFPEDKLQIIQDYKNTVMIGDGINDALALSHADVSITVKGSSDLALNTSDIYFLKTGLEPFIDLLHIQKSIYATLKRNLTLSLIYNVLAGGFAMFGYINPLWAAILMPISSLVILISTLWGFRK